MDCKIESIFCTLSGYARECQDLQDAFIPKLYSEVNRHFRKQKNRYSKSQAEEIVHKLKEFEDRLIQPHSPSMLLVLSIDYLIKIGHKETRLYFGHYSSEVKKLTIRIRTSKYKEHFLKHKEFFDSFVGLQK